MHWSIPREIEATYVRDVCEPQVEKAIECIRDLIAADPDLEPCALASAFVALFFARMQKEFPVHVPASWPASFCVAAETYLAGQKGVISATALQAMLERLTQEILQTWGVPTEV